MNDDNDDAFMTFHHFDGLRVHSRAFSLFSSHDDDAPDYKQKKPCLAKYMNWNNGFYQIYYMHATTRALLHRIANCAPLMSSIFHTQTPSETKKNESTFSHVFQFNVCVSCERCVFCCSQFGRPGKIDNAQRCYDSDILG